MLANRQFALDLGKEDDPTNAIVAMVREVRDFATASDLDPQLANRLCLVVEELIANIVRHSDYDDRLTIALEVQHVETGLKISVEDNAAPFDLTQPRDFAGPNPLTGGGVGMELVRRLTSDQVYRRTNGRNAVMLTLK